MKDFPKVFPLEGEAEEMNGQLQKCIRLFPHKISGEGHFAALIRKKGEAAEERAGKRKKYFPASAGPGFPEDDVHGFFPGIFKMEARGYTFFLREERCPDSGISAQDCILGRQRKTVLSPARLWLWLFHRDF